jgi:predicted metal-dependent peptidase
MEVIAMDPDTALAFSAARMLAVTEAPYLAAALFAVTPLAAPGLGTFAVDSRWRLYLDPACFASWTPSQAGAVLLHEIGHLVRDHAGRAESAGVDDHRRWNYAADAELNDDLLEAGSDLPPNCVTPQSLGCQPGDFAETYYAAIAPPPPPPADAMSDGTCGSGAGGPRRPWELGDSAGGADGGLDTAQADLVRRRVAVEIAAAATARGDMPGGWERWAAQQLDPPTVAWRKVLAGAIRQAVAWRAGMVDYSYHRPGRRRLPRIITPAWRRPIPTIAAVVDTSGSMSRADLDAAMAEVQGIASGVGVRGRQLRLLSVDAAAHSVTPVNDLRQIVLTGGGGTDMRVGITAAEALKPRPDAIVVLTDGDTPWPQTPGRAKLVCAVISAQPPARTPSWATTVHIPAGG